MSLPQHITLGSAGVFGVGLGVTAYLSVRGTPSTPTTSPVIDNTTRKLVGEGTRSLSAGFWFSLGHSSVVFGLAFLLALGRARGRRARCRTRARRCCRPSALIGLGASPEPSSS